MKRKVVVTGYYGCGNLGDEALRAAAVAALQQAGVDPLVLAGRDRFDPRRVLGVLRKGAGLVLGGGGLLQNATSSRSLLYYLGLIRLARGMRRPVFLIGQGLGPISGRFARAVTQRVLSRVDYLGVRDRASWELAAQLGVYAGLDGDLYFLNPPLPGAIARSDPPRIGVALSGRSVAGRTREWRRFLAGLSDDYELVFIPFFPREDLPLTTRIAAGLPHARVEPPGAIAAAEALIGGLSVLISSRLHPLEFALRAGTPMVTVPADPKIAAFAAEVTELGGPEIPCAEFPRTGEISALLHAPPPKERFAAAYAALHRRTKAGFDRFLTALARKIGGGDD